ncbi:MAG: hypothetical protein E7633_10810, partial [Ruminococcaceae bacterium]|nr:hypothetical protein [Oscillospiraceae bacterium]
MKKKILAILLAVMMLVGSMPMSLFAAEDFIYDPNGDGEYFVLKASDATIKDTDTTVDVNIDVLYNSGVNAMKYFLIYDKELTIVSKANVTAGDIFTDAFVTGDFGTFDQTYETVKNKDRKWDTKLAEYATYDPNWSLENTDDVLISTVYTEHDDYDVYSTEIGTICTVTFQIDPESTKDQYTVKILPAIGNIIRDDPDSPVADEDGCVDIRDTLGVAGVITVESEQEECVHEYT